MTSTANQRGHGGGNQTIVEGEARVQPRGFPADLTELQLTAQARARLAAIVECSDDAIVSKDLNGVIITWNQGAERLFGYTAQEAIGQSVAILIPSDRLDEEPGILKRVRRGERIEHYETVRRRKDGALRDVSLTVSPIVDAEGKVVGASKIARDITERKQAEQVRARLAAIIESSDDAIVSKDLNGVITSWNKGAMLLFGYTEQEAIGQPVSMLIPPDRWHEEPEILERLKRGERVDHFETIRLRKDGSPLEISLTISPIKDMSGKVVGASKIARDITERKRMEAELAAWQRELESRVAQQKRELAAARAQLLEDNEARQRLEAEIAGAVEREQQRLGQELHDGLAQELTAIEIRLNLMGRDIHKGLPALDGAVTKLGGMVASARDNALNLAMGFFPVEIEQHGLLIALEGLARRTQESFGVVCEVETDEQTPARVKDAQAVQLFRIAQEALHNAVKHAHPNRVVVRLTTCNGNWVLTVKDDGVGLRDDPQLPKGMGLHIMEYRARMIGGKLTVRNADVGAIVECVAPAGPVPASRVGKLAEV